MLYYTKLYSDIFRALLYRSFGSLEWGLSSPPKPHSFVSLPTQSTLSLDADYFIHIITNSGCFSLDNIYLITSKLVCFGLDVLTHITTKLVCFASDVFTHIVTNSGCFNLDINIGLKLIACFAPIILITIFLKPVLGIRCGKCLGEGHEQWVLPGKTCPCPGCDWKAPNPKASPKPIPKPKTKASLKG